MICGHLPQSYRMDFDSIVLCSKFPLPVKAMKKGLCVRIKSAIVTPKKNVNIDGIEIYNNKKVEEVLLKAEMISSPTRRRGSKNHHKFSYIVKKGFVNKKINFGEVKIA